MDSVYIKERRLDPGNNCPSCSSELDACTGISVDAEGTIPTDGSLTICVYCRALLEFAPSGYVFAAPGRFSEIPDEFRGPVEDAIGGPIKVGPGRRAARRPVKRNHK